MCIVYASEYSGLLQHMICMSELVDVAGSTGLSGSSRLVNTPVRRILSNLVCPGFFMASNGSNGTELTYCLK